MASSEHKALVLDACDSEPAIKACPVPQPQPGEVLVKVLATALNPIDWKLPAWNLPWMDYPGVVGTDAAGEVVALGEGVSNVNPGDKIVWQGNFDRAHATFQQYTCANASLVARIPSNVSVDEAASVPLAIATAFLGFFHPKFIGQGGGAALEPFWNPGYSGQYKGTPLLVLGGATSVGQYVIQVAKLAGFSPIITTASPHNTALLTSLGATHVLHRSLSASDLKAEVTKITSAPLNVVFDTVSVPATLIAGWALLAPGGVLIHLLDVPEEIKAGQDGKDHQWVLGNVNMRGQGELGVELYKHLEGWLKDGSIKPNRIQVLPNGLAGIPDGLELLRADKVSGTKFVAHPHD